MIWSLHIIYASHINLNILKSGDIIFRKEDSFLSDKFEKLNGKGYSHVGIIYKLNHITYVVHIERTDKNKDFKVVPIDKFLNKATRYIIKRVKHSDNINFTNQLQIFIKQSPSFDMDFDNKTDDKLYCTEFVYKFYLKSMHIKLTNHLSNFGFYKFISVGDILESPYLITILDSNINR
jgi:hypothetical protein